MLLVHRAFALLVVSCLLLTSSTATFAKVALMPLRDMVAESALIVLGEVTSTRTICDPCAGSLFPSFAATFVVNDTIKGEAQDQILVYFSSAEPSPSLSVGERCILLLSPWKDGYSTVNGYGGKLLVDGAVIARIYAVGEAEDQALEAVVSRLRGMKGGGNASLKGSSKAP